MGDALTFAEQSCRSGPRLEFGDVYAIDCERISFHKRIFFLIGAGMFFDGSSLAARRVSVLRSDGGGIVARCCSATRRTMPPPLIGGLKT
jgi:hypothetical protein